MKRQDLPTTVEALQTRLLQTQGQLRTAEQTTVALAATIEEQRETIAKQEQAIADLLAALRGKQVERIDPDQLLLFNTGDLETLLEESQADEPAPRRREGRRKHGRRLLPDHLPQEEILHELPEEERLCPHDGQPMQVIRYEESKQCWRSSPSCMTSSARPSSQLPKNARPLALNTLPRCWPT